MTGGKSIGAWVLAIITLACHAPANTAIAGGGPENVFLVVNSASWASQTVANHFAQLRSLPASNVYYIRWQGGLERIEADQFRQQFITPILSAIQQRGLNNQIDYIIYSSDFPTMVDISNDFKGQKLPPHGAPNASINSLTYLMPLTMTRSPGMISMMSNQYMRSNSAGRTTEVPTQGFHSWYGWGPKGELLEAGGQHYMLSSMLAVTSGRGNSVAEAVDYLQRSAAADGTKPAGTIYFCDTDDDRVKPRKDGFEQAIDELSRLHVAAEIVTDEMPADKKNVQGLMSGAKTFNWKDTQSTILAGAICDNLTSYGGILSEGGGQTPLTEFLRYGAAASSGTVVEPYAIQDKFPVPLIHVHYARGCTLLESFYQSVAGPFQLLIVGDPLCRPWATIPAVEVPTLRPGETISGTVKFKPSASGAATAIEGFVLFVDGRRVSQTPVDEDITLDTTTLADGFHELRFVVVEDSPIETQGRLIAAVNVDNNSHRMTLTSTPAKTVRRDEKIKLRGKAPGMAGIFFFHNGRQLGKVVGAEGEIEVDPRLLGSGPVSIRATGVARGSDDKGVQSEPLDLFVEPATPLPALKKPAPTDLIRGMQLQLADGKIVPVQETRDKGWLRSAGVRNDEKYVVSGYFEIPATDTYQFQVQHSGNLKLAVDGQTLHDGKQGTYQQQFLSVSLAPGLHRLLLVGRTDDKTDLRISFGGRGTASLTGDVFKHPK